jgi:hypothetical protein
MISFFASCLLSAQKATRSDAKRANGSHAGFSHPETLSWSVYFTLPVNDHAG